MTTTSAAYGQFGQSLAFAERTLTEILHQHLAKRDTKPETWYALVLIATRGPQLSRPVLIRDLERSRNVEGDVGELLAGLEVDGLIRGDAEVDLTTEGEALYRSLRAYISSPTVQLLSQFDIHDVETTVRTLQAIASQAAQESSQNQEGD